MNDIVIRSGLLRRSILLIWFISNGSLAFTQLSSPGNPQPILYEGSKPLKIYEIPVPEVKLKELTEERHPLLKPENSGIMMDVDFNVYETGTWDTLTDGTKLWRAGFHVKDASAINIVFHSYKLNKGVHVYLYDYNQQSVLGAFTDLNNKPNGILAISQIFSELVIIEIQVPHYLENAGTVRIAQIGFNFSSITNENKGLKDGWFGLSGDCNEDIGCYDNIIYQQLKYSVMRIVYSGGERCTGTLVNNLAQDGRNYVLTAEHCISDEMIANTSVFYFDYESPYCNGPDGNSALTVSGATIRAKGNNLDFVLLELLEPLPFYYHPYYAGWDATGQQPASGVTIHHPRGDVKKIAVEQHALTEATFSSEYVTDSHWLVKHWESGTTEAGSSGGAFFDENQRIVGSLTGGQAECGNPVNDYFQKLSSCWDILGYWLSPGLDNPDFMNGYDPYEEFWNTGDTLVNIDENEILGLSQDGLQWGSLSGHNSRYVTQFAEQFTVENQKVLFGILLNVADNEIASFASHIILKVWQGGDVPGVLLMEKDIPLADLAGNAMNLIELDTVVSVKGTFYVGYELFYDDPTDTFSVWMADNRIIQQRNTAFVYNGVEWLSLNDFTSGSVFSSFDIRPIVFDQMLVPVPDPEDNNEIRVYPNPVSDEIHIKFREMTAGPVQIHLYTITGQLIYQEVFPHYQTLIQLKAENLVTGVYLLKVTGDHGPVTIKLIITK